MKRYMTSSPITKRLCLAALLVAALSLSAVARAGEAADRKTADTSHEYLLHLPGIAGARWIDREMLDGLKAGGYRGEIETYDWTGSNPGLGALLNRKRNARQAKVVARKIEERLKDDPDARITLVGHSGGAGIAVFALEELADDATIESLVMLAPALSPGYDLSAALKHVRGKAHVFTSGSDAIVLGTGTSVFGTMDGVKTEAAGKVGFEKPEGADESAYEKLQPAPYAARWMKYHNIGDHIGCMSRSFARHVVAPTLRGEEETEPAPDDEYASRVFGRRIRVKEAAEDDGADEGANADDGEASP